MDGPPTEVPMQPTEVTQPSRPSRMIPVRNVLPSTESRQVVLPDYTAPTVKDVDFEMLRQEGVRVACIDVDNTLTPVGINRLDDPELGRHLKGLKERGVLDAIYLATGSGRNLKPIEDEIGAKKFTPPAGVKKPDPAYFEALLQETGCRPEEVVMIGDRVTHDVSGAEAAGLLTVLVDPIGKGAWYTTGNGWLLQDRINGTRTRELRALQNVRAELERIKAQNSS